MPETGARNDPFTAFRFRVTFDGGQLGGFSECSGLQMDTEVREYMEGGLNTHVLKFPSRSKQTNIVLKRGVVDRTLWDWHNRIVTGAFEERGGSILIYDDDGRTITMVWNFYEAFPCKWMGPTLNAAQSAVAVETLELCHQRLERIR